MSLEVFTPHKKKVRAADIAIQKLIDVGVHTFFGIPGGSAASIFDAICIHPKARLIESRQETVAAFEAAGYWHATGEVPCVAVGAGPGITNAYTGIASAYTEGIPMLILAGDVPWAQTGGRLLQSLGKEGLWVELGFRPITKDVITITSAASAGGQILHAWNEARDPRKPGPVLVVFPLNLASLETQDLEIHTVQNTHKETPSQDFSSLKNAVRGVVKLLENAERPLLVVGAAARPFGAKILQLCEALQCPWMTTPRGKGVLDETHRLSLRNGGMAASIWAQNYCKENPDVVLVLGSDFDDVSIGMIQLEECYLVHIDRNPGVFGRNIKTNLGICADFGAFLDLASAEIKQGFSRSPSFYKRLSNIKEKSPFDVPDFAQDQNRPIAPHRIIADLQKSCGDKVTLVSDIGEHMLFALHYFTVKNPNTFVIHLGLGSMGSGIGSAIGFAIGNPHQRVVCFCGDGCMQMVGGELILAKKMNLNILFVVMNDHRYNMVYHGFKHAFDHEVPWDTPPIDFKIWAQSMGIKSERISEAHDLNTELIASLWKHSGPKLLEVLHDPDIRIRGAGRNESLQKMAQASAEIC